MTHIASRGEGRGSLLFLFNITSAKEKGGGGGGGGGHCLYVGTYICAVTINFSPPPFLMITSPPPLFPNFTAPLFFVTILHILHYIIYRPHFLTTAFTAPIFRHPRNYRPAPTPFFVNFDWHRPGFWRWDAHMYQNFRGTSHPHPPPSLILSQMTPGK